MIGKIVSHYEIIEKLGQGGMGVIYKAKDLKLDKYVALKFLPAHMGTEEEDKSRFIQEAKASFGIDHPNIGTIYGIDETPDGDIFIAMAFYEGETLKDKIKKGQLPVDKTMEIAHQIAKGLAKAHEQGVIHRDLKPANVFITADGTVKIIDFGLAKLSGGMHLTRTGASLGTVAYMSPEQTRGEDLDGRTDIWALGVVMYEMLAGRLPFRGDYETAMMYSLVNEDPLPIESFRSDIPVELKKTIEKALQKDPKKRFQEMHEIVEALEKLIIEAKLGSLPVQPPPTLLDIFWAAVIRRKYTVLASVAGAAVIIAAVFLLEPLFVRHSAAGLGKSIVVLPLLNQGDPGQEYYSDGLTEEFINELSKYPQLLVISSKSSLFFKGSKLTADSIAIDLGVRFLLKGNIQFPAGRLRLALSLYDGESKGEVWKENYEMPRENLFSGKEKIISEILRRLGIEKNLNIKPRQVTSPDVYEAYLHGLYYRDKISKDDNLLAITFFSEALRKDSNYIPALVSIADAQVEQFRQGWEESPKHLTDAENYCRKALRLDSANSQALSELGVISDLRGNTRQAVELLLKAIDKDKNNAVALTSISWIYLFKLNDATRGLMYLKQLQEIEPKDWLRELNLGVAFAQMKNYKEAISSFSRAFKLNPEHEFPPYCLGYAYERLSTFDSALYFYKIALQKNPKNPSVYEGISSVYLATGKNAAAETLLTGAMKYLQGDELISYKLGVVYELSGKVPQARRIYEEGLKLVEDKIRKNPASGNLHAYSGLYNARLGHTFPAQTEALAAARLDSTNEDVIIKVARIYAVLGQKGNMLKWFRVSRGMNPEYDAAYLNTATDFEKFRNDSDLLSLARED